MISAVTIAHQPEPTTASTALAKPAGDFATSSQQSPQPQPASASSGPVDTVQISSAAQAALKESLETPAQTAKEAAGGDHQAQRLLAKEVAAEKA